MSNEEVRHSRRAQATGKGVAEIVDPEVIDPGSYLESQAAIPVGKPLNPFRIRLLIYSLYLCSGNGSIAVLVADLRWLRILIFTGGACWG